MKANPPPIAYVRTEDAAMLPPPGNMIGLQGWLRANLFPNALNSILTIVAATFILMIVWHILDWAVVRAAWTGENRDACVGANAGACWPFVVAKFPQWIYGFYPIDQRWRPNLVFMLAAAGLIPMLMPSMPYKLWNALFLLVAFPLIAIILLGGGHLQLSITAYGAVAGFLLLAASLLPFSVFGLESGIKRNGLGLGLALVGVAPALLAFMLLILAAIFSFLASLLILVSAPGLAQPFTGMAGLFSYLLSTIFAIPHLLAAMGALIGAGACLSLWCAWQQGGHAGRGGIFTWLAVVAALLLAMVFLDFDFGLQHVDSSDWGGLLVTLVVASSGIVASLPIGIFLALGRRSNMWMVKTFSVVFIEAWRGVPLITVLFMSSVMLPLFLPPGTNFDKLLRMLIGIALFSSAYMAETVRGGLQAIPKGQYEGAMALGLSYWQVMAKIVLPQALKIAIPNIVSSFISLFKDTTLVSIVGIYDLLGIITAGFADGKWASPQTAATGYFTAALMFWIFCFGMSRYAVYTERRLNTGHKR